MEAEYRLVLCGQSAPERAHFLEQAEGADDIGLDELTRAVNAAVDMALGGKVQHGGRAMLSQQACHQHTIADVALHQRAAAGVNVLGNRLRVARVGQFVEHHHRLRALAKPVMNEISADEAGRASDEDHVFENADECADECAEKYVGAWF